MNKHLIILTVFTPFVCGYYISYVFRTIVAVIASRLSSDLGFNVADIGVLTSVYFLFFALSQLPLGFMLDCHGPRRVQSVLLLVAASGATLFGFGHSFAVLLLSRAMIGIGVSGALMAGLKANTLWFPTDRLPLVNGWFVMLGGLGAVTATEPTEILLNWIGWRDLFKLLGIMTAVCAFATYLVVPECPNDSVKTRPSKWVALRSIYVDPSFWRLAPLSASCIGAAWALQGFWAAAWLADVDKLSRPEIAHYLLVMSLALCAGAMVLGVGANFLRKYGIRPRALLVTTMIIFISIELCLIARVPLPDYAVWSAVGCVSAATVLSYAVLADLFPKDRIGQANAGLNILHVGGGFAIQCFTGIVIQQWANTDGHYPAIAYRTAFSLVVLFQFMALVWFALQNPNVKKNLTSYIGRFAIAIGQSRRGAKAVSPYDKAIEVWEERLRNAKLQAASWRWAALGCLTVVFLLVLVSISKTRKSDVRPYVIMVEHIGMLHGAVYFKQPYQASDALISYFIAQFVEDVRSLSMDPIVVYGRWQRAYHYLTDRAAKTLNDYAAKTDPFSKIGIRTTAVEMGSVVRVSPSSFKVKWKEITYERQALLRAEQFTGAVAIIFKTSDAPERLRENPLGLYIHELNWSRDLNDETGRDGLAIRLAIDGVLETFVSKGEHFAVRPRW